MASNPRARYAYQTNRRLGKGAFAEVFLGRRVTGDGEQKVAVKRIAKSRMQADPKRRRLMRSEVSILRTLGSHANIGRLHECFENTEYMHLVLEYCDGGDLGAYLKKHTPVSQAATRDFLTQMTNGIKHLRQHDITHRDIKPQNVLLTSCSTSPTGFRICLSDFGFACRLGSDAMAETFCGSPLHMAPEIFDGGEYDPKIDLWSFGTIAYQMVTGLTPYRAKSISELKQKLRTAGRRSAPIPMPADAEPGLVDLVHRLLTVDPARRIRFDQFFAHPYVAPVVAAMGASGNSSDGTGSPWASDYGINGPTSFVLVDQHSAEFGQLLDRMHAASDAALQDDLKQIKLRAFAAEVVSKATAIIDVAERHPLCQQLLLYGCALRFLRDASASTRRDIATLSQEPCTKTLMAAQRFHSCLTHCLARVEWLRAEVYRQELAPTPSVAPPSRARPFEMLSDAATEAIEHGAWHEVRTHRTLSGMYFRRAILLLKLVQLDVSDARDRDRVDRLLAATIYRVEKGSPSSQALRLLADNKFTLPTDCDQPAAADVELFSSAHSSTSSDHPATPAPPARSAPIDIPTPPSGLGAQRARYCCLCGSHFVSHLQNFCSACGTQRSSLVAGSSSLGSRLSMLQSQSVVDSPSVTDTSALSSSSRASLLSDASSE